MSTTTIVLLPQEIIMEILSRLPASTLISIFKLVCKPWLNLIKDPDFIKMHHHHHHHHLNRGGGGGGGGGEGGASITNTSLIYKSGKDLFQLHPPFNFEGGDGHGLLPPIAAPTKKLDFDLLSLNSRLVGSCNVFVNEALHWVAASLGGHWDTIASFDIRDEVFRQVPTPLPCEQPYDDESSYFNLTRVILMNMKGCLSMIRFSHANNNNSMDVDANVLEIWVMKEYGIQESWTKEFVISSGDTDPPRALSEFKISWRPNAYVLKGDQILIEGLTDTKEGCRLSWEGVRKLVLYDINKRKTNGDVKMIGVPDEPYPRIDLVDYIETLVSLKSSIMAAGVLL